MQFNPSVFNFMESFHASSGLGDDEDLANAWGADQVDAKNSALAFDESFAQSLDFDDTKKSSGMDDTNNEQQQHQKDGRGDSHPGDSAKKKRVIKVKVVRKGPNDPATQYPRGDDPGSGKPRKRKVVKKVIQQPVPTTNSEAEAGVKFAAQSSAAQSPINERKKALHQLKPQKSPQTPSKHFVSKLYGSLSIFNNSGGISHDEENFAAETPGNASKAPSPPPPSAGANASGASEKRAGGPGLATSIGRYFIRNSRNHPVSASAGSFAGGGAGDESINTNNSRGSRGSLSRFVGKKSSREKHQLLGDDGSCSFDSGSLARK
jgi:hypothetical protein